MSKVSYKNTDSYNVDAAILANERALAFIRQQPHIDKVMERAHENRIQQLKSFREALTERTK